METKRIEKVRVIIQYTDETEDGLMISNGSGPIEMSIGMKSGAHFHEASDYIFHLEERIELNISGFLSRVAPPSLT